MIRQFDDPAALRDSVLNAAVEELSALPPLENERYRLSLHDVGYEPDKSFSLSDQKDAILRGASLERRLRGTWVLTDRRTGAEVDRRKQTLMAVPWATNRGTFIRGGNEYTVVHQFRLKPGVYVRRRESGEIEGHVNVRPRTGSSFRVQLEPQTGRFRLQVGQASLPLRPLLRAMGVQDDSLRQAWGALYDANAEDDASAVTRALDRLVHPSRVKELTGDNGRDLASIMGRMELDPEVTALTLGRQFKRVDPDVLLALSQKLVRVHRGEQDPDERDSLAYQSFHSMDDMIRERIQLDAGRMRRNLLWRATADGSLSKFPSRPLNAYIDSVFLSSGLAQPLEETNPMEIYDQHHRVIRLGEGGIPSPESVPDESREVQPSYLGYQDPVRSPESGRIGVDGRLAWGAARDDHGRLVQRFRDRSGRLVWLDPVKASGSSISTREEMESDEPLVRAMVRGSIKLVPREQVDYTLDHSGSIFSAGGLLVPQLSGAHGLRLLMGGKFLTQALPLQHPESPEVQAEVLPGTSMERTLGQHMGAVVAARRGRVLSVSPDNIVIRYDDGEKVQRELYNNFPFNRRTYIHNTPRVQPGDVVTPGQVLAASNYTDHRGEMALGRNLTVAYMPFRGLNYEDAIVLSESGARKLASEHMYSKELEEDEHTRIDRAAHISIYPGKYSPDQLSKLDDTGIVRPGMRVESGDPLVLALRRPAMRGERIIYRPHKLRPSDASVTWDHDDAGIVTDVVRDGKNLSVYIKSLSPMQVGDKLSGRYGDKGVIAAIIPDSEMIRDSSDNPVDVVLNPMGVISRGNPAQLVEAALGKVAHRTGRTQLVPPFLRGRSAAGYAHHVLSQHGLTDTEDVWDPVENRRIPGIFVGRRYLMKLQHTSEAKVAGRSATGEEEVFYTTERTPARGGETGAKRIGTWELNALAAQGAYELIRDSHLYRGQRNDEFWQALRLGLPLPTPGQPLVSQKLFALMKAAGINTEKRGNRIHLMALTDSDIRSMSTGAIQSDETIDVRTFNPKPGGLFDLHTTGGHEGNRWAHIELVEPMPNPVFEDPIRRLLGLTQRSFMQVLAGQDTLHGDTGPAAIAKSLDAIDMDREIDRARHDIETGRGTRREDAVRRLGYLEALKQSDRHPRELMWSAVPVLPPVFRPITQLKPGVVVSADANYLYRDLIQANKWLGDLKSQLSDSDLSDERLALYGSIKAVAGLGDPVGSKSKGQGLTGLLAKVFGSSPKFGLVQRRILGADVDMVGRSVIVPNPDLDMDEVGIPRDTAWTVYAPFVIRRLVQRGTQAQQAVQMVLSRAEPARRALEEELAQRPVLVNRAPTLHRYGIQALWPRLVDGNVVHVPPILTAGFGADFDGDAVNWHVPLSEEARREALKLLPSRNLLDSLGFRIHMVPRQEYLYGLYAARAKMNSTPVRVFRSAQDVVRALDRGEIGPNDPVEILEHDTKKASCGAELLAEIGIG